MSTEPRVSLDQWRVLQAVVAAGSFAAAAEQLNRSQSAVSYAIGQLQQQLPVPVLRQSGRRAVLTDAGAALLARAEQLLATATSIERYAQSLAQGWEPEVRIAADIICPPPLLLQGLARFSDQVPQTRVQVVESVLSGTAEALLRGEVDLAITATVPPGFIGQRLLAVEFLAVAAPAHPLHHQDRALTLGDLRLHRQLVVRDSGHYRNVDSGWLGAEQRWTLSHLRTSIAALKQGLGFAWVPRAHIVEDLAADTLRPLPLAEGQSRWADLHLVLADREAAGPATRQLAQTLSECVAACP